ISPVFWAAWTGAGELNDTFRIVAPQLQRNDFISPPILTSGTAVTGVGDFVTSPVSAGGRAFVLDVDVLGYTMNGRWLVQWDDGTQANRYSLVLNTTN